MRRTFLFSVAVCVALLLCQEKASASIHNIGVDIGAHGSQTIVPFYDQSSDGLELRGKSLFGWIQGDVLNIVVNTASVFGLLPLTSAELFIDAFGVDCWNASEIYVQGVLVGSLQNTPSRSSIPVVGGPPGTHVANSRFDVDNTFIDLSPFLTDLKSDSSFTIQIKNTTAPSLLVFPGEKFRVDGINIQVAAYAPLPVVTPGTVPEPATVVVWSFLAATAMGVCCRARRLA